ncbi:MULTISPECIES: hypothetical protein [Paenibacillus]|jgi:uncharacterized membrane protein YjjP (DUF1212 family)|uniref:Conjugal transfer protein TrbC n=1 Tax=Paenibacillus lautus TaxID=1401 RepID=A0A385U048_PAELA|nr:MULTISPECIES: hypothetical protein [Paenibacillus]VTR56413.1 Uncharacterised protein [Actinobacillus pleuropneumoniae]AWP25215.1 hypothetical protein B9D94_00605 [Paenibacillus sp. Cedars]AYB48047.1 hypothetical protein D5F53_32495 [Paenibacillus lautus]MBX4152611.1 hypothetical protein [Paenibacillus lautus]MCT1402889.1 hypothetical protein [Paenibacillus sp. p3-SID867]
MRKLNKDLVIRTTLLSIALMLMATPAFASGPGQKLGTWLTSNIGAVIPGILITIGAYHMIKRDWMKLVSFMGIALIVAVLMNWEDVKKLSKYFFDAIFGGI